MATNLFMDRTPASPEARFSASAGEFLINLRDLITHPRLSRLLVGTSLFWFCGAMIKMNFQPWGQQVLGLQTMTQVSLLGLWLSIGIMIGSVAAGQLFPVGQVQGTRKFGFALAVALAALGSAKWLIAAGLTRFHPVAIAILICAGVAAGLFLIPLNAALQAESHRGKMGKTIATQNLLENLAMLASSVFAYVNVTASFDPSQLFLALAAVVAVVVALLRIPAIQLASRPIQNVAQ
jgi:LPLT family lysophospholipid transporter-like MFS transporter